MGFRSGFWGLPDFNAFIFQNRSKNMKVVKNSKNWHELLEIVMMIFGSHLPKTQWNHDIVEYSANMSRKSSSQFPVIHVNSVYLMNDLTPPPPENLQKLGNKKSEHIQLLLDVKIVMFLFVLWLCVFIMIDKWEEGE